MPLLPTGTRIVGKIHSEPAQWKSYWPPSSPHLMDFAMWGILAQKACFESHKNVESLKNI